MKKIFTSLICITLLVSCDKLNEKFENIIETSESNSSNQDTEEKQTANEDYKSLEGTPFTFNNSICSRKLFGSDFIKVLSNYKFTPINGNDYPYISRLNESGYLKVIPQKNSKIFYGNMKVSANGEFIFFDAYVLDLYQNYQRTDVKMKFTPIQKPNLPFQIDIEIEQSGKLIIKEKLTIAKKNQSKNYTTNGC